MELETVVKDTLRQNGLPEREMISQDKHGAIVELAESGTPKKLIARMPDIDPKTVRKILAKQEWAPEVGFNARALFQKAKLPGYTGCYERIKTFVRPLREERRLAMEATLRFETAPGKQGQVDWDTSAVWMGGVICALNRSKGSLTTASTF